MSGLFDSFGNRAKYVRARVWANNAGFSYPELELPSLGGKTDLGVAFSGGGTRSAAATVGQLRGLKEIGLLDKVKYVSTVSGGTWGAAPFVFLPDAFDEDEFLGEALAPSDITIESLDRASRRSMVHAISDSTITDDFFEEAARLAGDETFSRAIGNIFLEPFDLDDNHRFLTFDDDTLLSALARNSRLVDSEHFLERDDFYVARAGRPFLIAGSTIFSDQRRTPRIHTEFTPYYSGTRNLFKLADPVGGGYVETIGCDSEKPRRRGSSPRVRLGRPRHRFSLADLVGASGAAPQELFRKANLTFVGFPEFRHWGFTETGGFTRHNELSYGDGGHIENLGIMPLLARGVRNIIVFVNSKTPFHFDGDVVRARLATSIPNLFKPASDGFRMNLVIKDDDQHTRYRELLAGLEQRRRAGKALIFASHYDIRSNKHYSVKSYSGVRICWVYNHGVPEWTTQLKFQVRKMITDGEVARFPHYRTFFQNPPKIIDLTRAEAGLLAHLSCWNVTEHADLLTG